MVSAVESSPTPPVRKSHRTRNIAAIVIIVIVVLVVIAASFTSTSTITVTGLNVHVQYDGSVQGYFGPTQQSASIGNQPNQVLTLTGGQQFIISDTFTESSLATGSHSLNNITVTTQGFTIVSVDPELPITFSPGSTVRITITFQAPNSDFNGAVNVVFATT